MKRIAPVLLALTLLSAIPLALAQETVSDDRSAEMRLGNDLYTAGDGIDIMENIDGDVNAAGNSINITGNVGADVQAAGSNVHISGNVGDDVRVAAGNVIVSGNVAGDIIAFGGSVTISRGATVSGNVLVAGGTFLMEGTVSGNVRANTDEATIAGPVGGDLNVNARHMTLGSAVTGNAELTADSITLAQDALIGGDLRYWNEAGQINTTGKVAGAATFDAALGEGRMHDEADKGALGVILSAISVYMVLYAALTIGLFMLATRTFFTESAKRLRKAPGWSLLMGLLYFIVTPAVIVLLAVTLIGLPVAIALLLFYLMSIFFAKILASIVLARWAEMSLKKKWHPAAVYFAALGFYIVLSLLTLIPFIGWVLVFLAIVTAYGAFATVKYERFQKIR